MAVLSQREGLEFEGAIASDTAPLHGLVEAMIGAGEIHALRDPTRGGLGTSLCEIAAASSVGVEIDARKIPVREEVRAACELLGLDPLYVANEGKLVSFVKAEDAEAVLAAMRQRPEGREAALIGEAVAGHAGMVLHEDRGRRDAHRGPAVRRAVAADLLVASGPAGRRYFFCRTPTLSALTLRASGTPENLAMVNSAR